MRSRAWIAVGAATLGIILLLTCATVVESSTLEQATDTPTPTSTPTPYPTPTRVYSTTSEPLDPPSPPSYDDYSVIPQGDIDALQGSEPDMDCPTFDIIELTPWSWDPIGFPDFSLDAIDPSVPPVVTFSMSAWTWNPISFPDLGFTPMSPTVPGVYTFTMNPFTLPVPDWNPISLPVPSLPLTATGFEVETSTVTVTLPFSLVFNFTAVTSTWQPVITRAYQLQEDVEDHVLGGFGAQAMGGGLSIQSTQADELRSMEISGYTASEMAAEMTAGMTTAFDFVRAITDIGILGPTVTAIVVGLGWITLVTLGKFVFKSVILVIDVVKVLLDLVIDLLKLFLEVIHLIPFI